MRSGKFYSVLSGQYGRSDNNRPNFGFEQYGGYLKLGYDFLAALDGIPPMST